jgi:amino-acid N-acetyltransferase
VHRLRPATEREAPALHALITRYAEEGHLLPRTLDELTERARQFIVAVPADGGDTASDSRGLDAADELLGCAELAPLGPTMAEIRSLVVERRARRLGIGRDLVRELAERARGGRFEAICAFTHDPALFLRLGFSVVPHARVPEKIAQDCRRCRLFPRCGQHAMLLNLPGALAVGRSIPLPAERG